MSNLDLKVSIIIPFYNRVDWVLEAVESAQNQTHKNIEIILIDDGSTEDTEKIQRIHDIRIRYFRQVNKGVSSARNKGMELATGDYIAFLDSDDFFLPEKLEIQLEHFRNNPEVGLVHSSYFQINENGDIIQEIDTSKMTGNVFPSILYKNQIATPTVLVKKEAIIQSQGFNEDVKIGEDTLFWSEIAENYSFLGTDKCLSKVRIHSTSTSVSIESILVGNNNILSYLHLFQTLRFDQKIFVKFMLYINIVLLTALKTIYQNLNKYLHINLFTIIHNTPLLMRIFGNCKIVLFN